MPVCCESMQRKISWSRPGWRLNHEKGAVLAAPFSPCRFMKGTLHARVLQSMSEEEGLDREGLDKVVAGYLFTEKTP